MTPWGKQYHLDVVQTHSVSLLHHALEETYHNAEDLVLSLTSSFL